MNGPKATASPPPRMIFTPRLLTAPLCLLVWLIAGTGARAQAVTTDGFIDLLPTIDPAKDTVQGTWKVEKQSISSSGDGQERIEIPYRPPDEYDFRVAFTKLSGTNCVIQLLARREVPFLWVMSTDGMFTFHYLKGAGLGANRTTLHRSQGIAARTPYVSVVKVRNTGVQVVLNGQTIDKWPTDYSDIEIQPYWLLRDKRLLGLATGDARTVFRKVELKEITGRGKFTR
ncbi:MAG: hypothetical protein P4L99_17355 [Chthoniobacter sp.]|nr:hypothetical protein [Chthoniobacter sp.]